jgi:hypothetical protein
MDSSCSATSSGKRNTCLREALPTRVSVKCASATTSIISIMVVLRGVMEKGAGAPFFGSPN